MTNIEFWQDVASMIDKTHYLFEDGTNRNTFTKLT